MNGVVACLFILMNLLSWCTNASAEVSELKPESLLITKHSDVAWRGSSRFEHGHGYYHIDPGVLVNLINDLKEQINKLSNRLDRTTGKIPKASKLVALFATDTCPEDWTKTKWPYRKPIDKCTDKNCKMVSMKELPGYIACEKN